ncbi:uncharacterized protein LOC135826516 [Sycon ciliatum]|uniref:uncharacterized protein LOC135826516 n=1 Tax=Sycon ciliatum TaxID=27933 RepID=UPI0020AB8432|eukprot:scpid27493/ scgid1991/ 
MASSLSLMTVLLLLVLLPNTSWASHDAAADSSGGSGSGDTDMKAYENCLANKHVTMTMQMESSPGESEHEAEPAAQPQTQTEHFEFAGSSMAMELKRSCCELGARVPAERAAAVEFKQGPMHQYGAAKASLSTGRKVECTNRAYCCCMQAGSGQCGVLETLFNYGE